MSDEPKEQPKHSIPKSAAATMAELKKIQDRNPGPQPWIGEIPPLYDMRGKHFGPYTERVLKMPVDALCKCGCERQCHGHYLGCVGLGKCSSDKHRCNRFIPAIDEQDDAFRLPPSESALAAALAEIERLENLATERQKRINALAIWSDTEIEKLREFSNDMTKVVKTQEAEIDELKSEIEEHKETHAFLNERISWLEMQREIECRQKEDALNESGECLKNMSKSEAARDRLAAENARLKSAVEDMLAYYNKYPASMAAIKGSRHVYDKLKAALEGGKP